MFRSYLEPSCLKYGTKWGSKSSSSHISFGSKNYLKAGKNKVRIFLIVFFSPLLSNKWGEFYTVRGNRTSTKVNNVNRIVDKCLIYSWGKYQTFFRIHFCIQCADNKWPLSNFYKTVFMNWKKKTLTNNLYVWGVHKVTQLNFLEGSHNLD